MSGEKLNSEEAAHYLGVTKETLANWRSSKRFRIPYYKAGRLVYYRKTDIDAWIESRMFDNNNSEIENEQPAYR